MGEHTTISWVGPQGKTFNPWMGCTKVSPACAGCYAEALMDTRYGKVSWGPGEDRVRTSAANWRQPLRWNRQAAEQGTRPFVFCASLADVFDNEVDPAWRRDLFALIEATPHLVWLLLTKRIGNVLRMTDPARGNPLLPANAAIGATMANQEEYDRDARKLAEVRRVCQPLFTFGSFEPLLGRIILDEHAPDWVISGGATHQGQWRAPPSHPNWFRGLRDQSAALGRVYHHKQNGEWISTAGWYADHPVSLPIRTWTGTEWTDDGRYADREWVALVGKKVAGRLLDGVEHNGMPLSAEPATATEGC